MTPAKKSRMVRISTGTSPTSNKASSEPVPEIEVQDVKRCAKIQTQRKPSMVDKNARKDSFRKPYEMSMFTARIPIEPRMVTVRTSCPRKTLGKINPNNTRSVIPSPIKDQKPRL